MPETNNAALTVRREQTNISFLLQHLQEPTRLVNPCASGLEVLSCACGARLIAAPGNQVAAYCLSPDLGTLPIGVYNKVVQAINTNTDQLLKKPPLI